MPHKTTVCRLLDKSGISYDIHEYDWNEEELDAPTVAVKVGIDTSQIFKTLVLSGDKTGILMACVPGDKELDLKALAHLSENKKVEMVAVKELLPLTGYVRGGVSPLGTKRDYPLFVDESMVKLERISISAGKRGLQIFLKGSDLVALRSATTGPISKYVVQ